MEGALRMNLLMRYFITKPSSSSSKKSGGGPVVAGVLTTSASPSLQNDVFTRGVRRCSGRISSEAKNVETDGGAGDWVEDDAAFRHYKIRMDLRIAAALEKTAGASQKTSFS